MRERRPETVVFVVSGDDDGEGWHRGFEYTDDRRKAEGQQGRKAEAQNNCPSHVLPFCLFLFFPLPHSGYALLVLFNPPFLIAILIALTVHEWAHALVADRLGDPTPRSEGRLTLNPIAHLDPLGTLMFFVIHFGWGKPVPINPRYFKHYRRDTALVSLAGPFSNLILAIIAFILLFTVAPQMTGASGDALLFMSGANAGFPAFLSETLANLLFINLALMAFNLIPIAPLDGSKILQAFIPLRYEDQYDKFLRNGPFILLGLIIAERAFNIPLIITWVSFIMDSVLRVMGMFV